MRTPLTPRSDGTRYWVVAIALIAAGSYWFGTLHASDSTSIDTSATLASVVGVGSAAPKGMASTVEFNQFWDLWTLLKEKYYQQPLDERVMLYGAMQGLAASTKDPYTNFFEPEIATEFSQSLAGKFEGIGAEIGIKDNQLQIISPLPDMPAERAGLKAGDAILNIDATSTEGMSVDYAVSLIRGKKGTKVTLTIGRIVNAKPEQKDVSIIRNTITVKSVQWKMLDGNIAKIDVRQFNEDTAVMFGQAADWVLDQNAKGIILDVRNDPGGLLDRATAVASEWVGDQVIVLERRQGKIVEEYRGTGKGRLKGIPTVVLMNQGSASASEIVTGALQDYGVATVVGEQSFGKGSVQDYTELRDGTAVKITIAEWLTPKQRAINGVGLTPDVLVPLTEENTHDNRDPQLDKALEILRPTSTTTGTSAASPR